MMLNPLPNYPTYPPYHKGLYLEEYFINFWKNNYQNTERILIPVSWTSYYNNGLDRKKLQLYLNSLPKEKKYFVVSQHDDAPSEILPPNTLIFSAGGNIKGNNIIPIPLICSKLNINNINFNKNIFCSFVGSLTHDIRKKLCFLYKNKYTFYVESWSSSVEEKRLQNFIDTTVRSKFSLCPRGYGASSFRLYEVMQLNSIPVYISDYHHLPWTDELNWNEFCIIVSENEIHYLDDILKSITDEKYEQMLRKMNQVYNNYFTLEMMCTHIIKRINK